MFQYYVLLQRFDTMFQCDDTKCVSMRSYNTVRFDINVMIQFQFSLIHKSAIDANLKESYDKNVGWCFCFASI